MSTINSYSMESINVLKANQKSTQTQASESYLGNVDFASYLLQSSNAQEDHVARSVSSLIKPSPTYFAEITGSTYEQSLEMVYGIVGSGEDLRDWAKIMSSSDPLAEARKETSAMYNSVEGYSVENASYLDASSIVSNEHNLAVTQSVDETGKSVQNGYLVTSENMILRSVNLNAEDILNAASLYGFDVENSSYFQNLAQMEKTQEVAERSDDANELVETQGSANQESIETLYRSYLGREADLDGLAYWTQKMDEGVSLKEIEKAFLTSTEFKLMVSSDSASSDISEATTTTEATLADLLKLL